MGFITLQEILTEVRDTKLPFWRVVLTDDMKERNVSEQESFETMRNRYFAMKQADTGYNEDLRSASGLAGGDGARLEGYRKRFNDDSKGLLLGTFLAEVVEKAVKMGESNACMRRIVAAPTAGSCGVIPAVLITYENQYKIKEEKLVEALFVAAGIGEVLAASACISGAEGGCQAEIGSASAMAAGALTYLEGGTSEQIANAAAFALKNMLGLTCDPVAGLVEIPCIKRNASGAINAALAAWMTLAGVQSAIKPDEVVDTMRRIGNLIPVCLKETGKEGLANTESAQKVTERMM